MKVTALAPWFGSKRTMAPLIAEHLGPHRAYVEPFAGSMAVLLAKPACPFEIVNDLHGDLTNLAWTIQHDREGPRLYRRLRRTFYDEATFKAANATLADWPLAESPEGVTADTHQRAFRYFVLSWMGRSGAIGTAGHNNCFTLRYAVAGGNQAGQFAAAVDSIPAWRRRMRSVTITRRCGLELLERLYDDPRQAIYCDPPYLVKNASYKHDFAAADHVRLAAALHRFKRTRIVLSYYAAPQLAEWYPSWTQLDCPRCKSMASSSRRGAARATAPEVLLVNRLGGLFSGGLLP